MLKVINYCGNCPFSVTIGGSYICNLARYEGEENFYLRPDKILETPEWCALKREEHYFRFRNFSKERIKQINEANLKLGEIGDTDPKETANLNKKLHELYQNEELPSDNPMNNLDFSNEIEEIRQQLVMLQEAGDKLKDTFMDLGNADY